MKSGYKQTDIGILPADWEVAELQKVADVRDGTHDSPKYQSSGIPFVTSKNIVNGRIDLSNVTYISPEDAEIINNRSKVDRGDILISMIGTVGNCALIDFTPNFCIKNVALVKPLNSNGIFLALLFGSPLLQSLFRDSLDGGIQQFISLGTLRKLLIPLPPPAEQRAIASALSEADASLTALDEQIAKKRDLKQAAMQQLLTGKKRLPGFSDNWIEKSLGECLFSNPRYGINAAAVGYSDVLPTYLRITDISENGTFNPEPKVSVDHPLSNQYILEEGDIVFARTGASVGKSYLYNTNDGELVFAGFLIQIKPDPHVLVPQFLAFYTQTDAYWNWVQVMSMRSGQPGINGNEFSQLVIPVPPTKEQAAIAEILSDMDAEVTALEKLRAKQAAIKQGMMQELLTGRTRLI